ncbi:reverse transcriptase zinc-binding domain-containing protein [Tanacetum coccineum]|uniref:Reverse transcriptase zinc-binding domain-containing protein n=1 Tax=Tanacetum coccineum TaxID=301880 RepID=A0ABQ5FQK9_9ASTR
MGSNEEIVQLLQKTQTIFKQTQRDKEEKYLNDSIQLQDKIKDLENVVCKMGRSTDTLRLLTSEQKAFKDNLHKSGVGYNGPFVLSQAYAKIPKLYRTSELCDKNEQLHVFDYEETLEDAEKRLCSSKELSAEQTYFSSSFIPCVKDSVKILETKSMPNQLLEASLTEDIKNLVITSCMEIRNKDLHDEIERISKESNDVSFEVTQGLSNLELWELEIYCQKSEAKISEDAVMLRVFPFTLTGAAKRWVDRLAPGTINTWDLLKKAFIQRYCPPSMTAKQLEDIHNFKQEGDESLYQA